MPGLLFHGPITSHRRCKHLPALLQIGCMQTAPSPCRQDFQMWSSAIVLLSVNEAVAPFSSITFSSEKFPTLQIHAGYRWCSLDRVGALPPILRHQIGSQGTSTIAIGVLA